mgnify:CR=1 FL=1
MITTLRNTDRGLEEVQHLADGCWVNLVDPSADEIAGVQQAYGIPADYLTNPLDPDERARIEKEDSALLIILRAPYSSGENADVPYTTVPLGLVITDRVIITVCKVASGVPEELIRTRSRSLSTAKQNQLFLLLFLIAAKRFLQCLRAINKDVDLLEDQLEASLGNREVLSLLKYQKSLTYFTTALRANELMMGRLQRGTLFRMYPDDEELLDDALTEIGQAVEMTNIASGILSQMMDAFASIISNNLNVVMKFLTSITIVLALPTLIASIYGMNVKLPLGPYPHAFAIVMGGSAVLASVVMVVFRRLNWL